jgi:hypothetical protein
MGDADGTSIRTALLNRPLASRLQLPSALKRPGFVKNT